MKIRSVIQTISLLDSMVRSGENHSDESKQMVEDAQRVLSRLAEMPADEIKRVDLSLLFSELLLELRSAKSDKRNEVARRFAVTITELEKVDAYFSKYILDKQVVQTERGD